MEHNGKIRNDEERPIIQKFILAIDLAIDLLSFSISGFYSIVSQHLTKVKDFFRCCIHFCFRGNK